MAQSPRELVIRALTFQTPERIPRDLWVLPWAEKHFPDEVRRIRERFPGDLVTVPYFYPPSPRIKGDPYKAGTYIDEWGCKFYNLQDGIIGEVVEPVITDLSDWKSYEPPYEQLLATPKSAYDEIRAFYDSSDQFVMANICPRLWERYQFLRGTENALIDVLFPESGTMDLLKKIHEFYLQEIEFWARSAVDGIMFMDDWGTQDRLLIRPQLWRELFKPFYKEYCDAIHAGGKFVFMHSDGYITDIFPDIIEIGVDAINSQLFCMNMEELAAKVKGTITLWGEIDRQRVLPSPDPEEGRKAVREIARHFYDPKGGIIAQFEFGVGANPATAFAIFEEWEQISREKTVVL